MKQTKGFKGFLFLLLSALGLTSCETIGSFFGGGMVCMYGSPNADYSIEGNVVDQNKKPISGIQVIVEPGYRNSPSAGYIPDDTDFHPNLYYADTLYSDAKGAFKYEGNIFTSNEFHVKVSDVDGSDNGGQFLPEEIFLTESDFTQVKKGDNSWYGGSFKAEDLNISLKKADAE